MVLPQEHLLPGDPWRIWLDDEAGEFLVPGEALETGRVPSDTSQDHVAHWFEDGDDGKPSNPLPAKNLEADEAASKSAAILVQQAQTEVLREEFESLTLACKPNPNLDVRS